MLTSFTKSDTKRNTKRHGECLDPDTHYKSPTEAAPEKPFQTSCILLYGTLRSSQIFGTLCPLELRKYPTCELSDCHQKTNPICSGAFHPILAMEVLLWNVYQTHPPTVTRGHSKDAFNQGSFTFQFLHHDCYVFEFCHFLFALELIPVAFSASLGGT